MAAVLDVSVTQPEDGGPEILTDAQIEELLQEAEDRLRQKVGLASNVDNETLSLSSGAPPSASKVRLSKLEHNLYRSSYIKNHNGVAKTNPSLMVPTEQRKMADGLRTLNTQQASSKKIVSSPSVSIWSSIQYEEILSQTSLDADQHLILRMPCYHESI